MRPIALIVPTAALAAHLLAGTASAAPTAGDGASTALHGGTVTCGGTALRLHLQVDPGAQPNLRIRWHLEGARPGGRDWHLPAEHFSGAPVVLDAVAGHPKARLEGLGSNAPLLRLLAADLIPLPDCPEVALEAAPPVLEQYAVVIDRFAGVDPVRPDNVAAFRAARAALPPPDLLPPLDGPEKQRRLRAVDEALITGLGAQLTEALDLPDNPQAAATVQGLRGLWLAAPGGREGRDMLELVRDAQGHLALALLAAGRDPAAEVLADTGAETVDTDANDDAACAALAIAAQPMWGQDIVQIAPEALLELVSTLPLIHWTRAMADAQLDVARRCAAPGYADLLAREWPRIEARAAALAPLSDWITRARAVPVTLGDYDRANWLTDAPTLPRAADLSREQAEALILALREPVIRDAMPVLAQEMAEGLEGVTDPRRALDHCHARSPLTAPAAADLPARVVAGCEEIAADRLREVLPDLLAADLARVTAAPATLQGAIDTDGFAVLQDLTGAHAGTAFAPVMADIRSDIAAATTAMRDRRDAVLGAERDRLTAVVEALVPGRDSIAGLPDCAAYEGPQNWLRPLQSHCRDLRVRYGLRDNEVRCIALFDAVDAPEALRTGQIALGGGETTAVRSILCDGGYEVELTERGGMF